MEQLNFIRNAGETRRFHTFPVLRTQNIAEHSWHLTMLLYLIYGQQEPGLTPALLMAGLTHDMAEHKVGDLPAPAKRTMSERLPMADFRAEWDAMEQDILMEQSLDFEKFLTEDERHALKLCDAMDGALYCVRERAMGNQLIAECFQNFMSYVYELLGPRPFTAEHGDRHLKLQPIATKTSNEIAFEVCDYIYEEWDKYDV